LVLQPNLSQWIKPIGGVRATPLSRRWAGVHSNDSSIATNMATEGLIEEGMAASLATRKK
jgi:hypothetical protein